ncbi:MAG: hypothetical protein K0B16_18340, partial [Burkholderiaceae bacterium]|nr:hypothetical protein [Burkholderiaceae bacterium]
MREDPEFDREAFLAGRQTPVFFGSAINDFGVREVLDALVDLAPLAANAGAHPPVVMNAVLDSDGDLGFDAATSEFTDLLARGIIDPAKVVRAALQNAASVAGLLLTTSCADAEWVAHADSDGANESRGDGR